MDFFLSSQAGVSVLIDVQIFVNVHGARIGFLNDSVIRQRAPTQLNKLSELFNLATGHFQWFG